MKGLKRKLFKTYGGQFLVIAPCFVAYIFLMKGSVIWLTVWLTQAFFFLNNKLFEEVLGIKKSTDESKEDKKNEDA